MNLANLLKDFFSLPPAINIDIARLTLDSRKVLPRDLFIALPGTVEDGREYIHDAIDHGAVAVLVESHSSKPSIHWQQKIPIISIDQLREKISHIAAIFYDFPAKKLRLLGVTGTNGKTSCSHFFAQSLQRLGFSCGIIGTLGHGFYGALQESGLTTPDVISLQKIFREFVDQQAQLVAMEVSSHGIQQKRINDLEFIISLFTNLTQDHLDYHGNMENYAAVKKSFLLSVNTKNVVINVDDYYGQRWLSELAHVKSVFSYSLKKPLSLPKNVWSLYSDAIQFLPQGMRANIHSSWGTGKLFLPLMGQFNLSNALGVLTSLCVLGISFHEALEQMSLLSSVEGRMQVLGGERRPLVVVDYAHTPDALEKVLQTLRDHTEGQLICVFGCGGDRDKSKRPLMASIAERWADRVIVTNDNPRYESPFVIAEQIVKGFNNLSKVVVELDRSKAIQNSIQLAKAQDCILVAGKGAERYQQIGDQKIPFDDVQEVEKSWRH